MAGEFTSRAVLAGFVAVAAGIALLEWANPEPTSPQTVVLTPAHREFVRQQLSQPGMPTPSDAALAHAMENYIEEEVLYREGLKLGLDQDDLIVKRRVVQKMRFLLEGMTPLEQPSKAQLQAYLDAHADQYQTGHAVQFEHVFFSRGKRGDEALLHARQHLALLANKPTAIAGDPFPLDASQTPVDHLQLNRDLGSALVQRIVQLPVGQWSEPMNSALGVHLVKVIEHRKGRTMTVEEAGEKLRVDVMAAQREAMNDAALATILSSYSVEERHE
ncbi:MAG TPA: peptidylprolyl isomerase [Limnobacter sp.]|nr:peptidylprolyl isomerase [Limnobacter sp.]